MAGSIKGSVSGAPGVFPNDTDLRGQDRRGRRQLPASDGNPARVNHGAARVVSVGVTPEGLRPSATIDGPAGSYGLGPNDGMGPN